MSFHQRILRLEHGFGSGRAEDRCTACGQASGERIEIPFGDLQLCDVCGALIIPEGFDEALTVTSARRGRRP